MMIQNAGDIHATATKPYAHHWDTSIEKRLDVLIQKQGNWLPKTGGLAFTHLPGLQTRDSLGDE